jgi:putative transposase
MDSKNMTTKDLDACQIEEVSRKIQHGGYLQFESLRYRGDNLAIYEGENVILKFDPRNILTLSVYRREGETDVFLARAYTQDWETEKLSLDDEKAMKLNVREKGKEVMNR